MAPVATEFERIIHTARERKRNEALADKIFSKGRRQSAPAGLKASQPGGSLASRVGVKKSQPKATPPSALRRRANGLAGDVNGEWTHDLHTSVNRPDTSNLPLSSRITLPGAPTTSRKAPTAAVASKKKFAKLSAAVDRMDTDPSVRQQVNVVPQRATQRIPDAGMTIRGLAGPFAVMAQNFAPGTTAADVESAMTPVGGEMLSCEVVKTHPFMIVEMVFASREGGERVIETFNNKTADGRILKVYPKPGGYKPPRDSPSASSGGRQPSSTRAQVVDGSMGFPENDLMATDNMPPRSRNSSNNRLNYHNNNNNHHDSAQRRGRGFQRGHSNNGR
ncbi:hypothetical protein MKX07_003793 [Trichoderma sp. CBMAI-0711]|uniref:RRM domain-containing protein n=1 Tax=Trichoderma parareesei TaxID=858221 RepID=A0A2H2ZK95_TRIPA|nr:hypothetical protein MKX07_003793 [Trichoderma sp. CBMAI-0711]OTA03590.1 hypothetical protein A9Z42_0040580 [Trichoderma parareesei]